MVFDIKQAIWMGADVEELSDESTDEGKRPTKLAGLGLHGRFERG